MLWRSNISSRATMRKHLPAIIRRWQLGSSTMVSLMRRQQQWLDHHFSLTRKELCTAKSVPFQRCFTMLRSGRITDWASVTAHRSIAQAVRLIPAFQRDDDPGAKRRLLHAQVGQVRWNGPKEIRIRFRHFRSIIDFIGILRT